MTAFAAITARSAGDALMRVELAKPFRGLSGEIEVAVRAAVNGTDITGLKPYRDWQLAFAAGLRHISLFDALVAAGAPRIPSKRAVSIVTAVATGHRVTGGAAKPISRLTIGPGALLEALTFVGLVVVSDSLLRSSAADGLALFERELSAAAAGAMNGEMVASLSAGLTPIAATGDPVSDIAALLAAITTSSRSTIVLAVSSTIAKQWTTARTATGGLLFPQMTVTGGTVQAMPVVVLDELNATILALDASGIALTADDTIRFDTASHGSIEMSDAPTGSSVTPTPTSLVSLFQTNGVALRVERLANFLRLRDSAAAIVTGADYAVSP